MADLIKRKDFLMKIFFAGIATTGMGTILSSCGDNEKKPVTGGNSKNNVAKETANDPCTDTSNLTSQELQVRKAYKYTGHSPNPEQVCNNCNYWQGLKNGGPCGTCQVVKGPINPKGHCTVWTKKVTS